MPVETLAATTSALARQRRAGLRVALAVAVGLTFGMATGAVLPFLGPLFAAQFLMSDARPVPPAKAIAMIGLVLVAGQALILASGAFGDRPLQLLILLGLVYFACFAAQAGGKGGPAVFLCLVIAVIVPLLDQVHDQLDTGIVAILLQGCVGGVLLSWLAHAALPGGTDESPVAPAVAVERPSRRALADTAILLGAMVFCLTSSGHATALVLPITVASLLLQLDAATSARAAVGLVAVNLFGGVLASLAYAFVELRPSLPLLFLTVLLVGLFLGGRAAGNAALARFYGGALTTFLILFGTGIAPLPATTPESFATRLGFVLQAVGYTLCMTALLWPRRRRAGTRPGATAIRPRPDGPSA